MNLGQVAYVPQLKWKAGERAAVTHVDRSIQPHLLPLFRLCPPGAYESDLGVQLDEGQFLKNFGKHFSEVCGRSPVLLDGELLSSSTEYAQRAHPFNQLLTRARMEGAFPLPVFRKKSDQGYREAIAQHLSWSGSKSACLRIELFEIESIESREELIDLVTGIGADLQESVLVIDGGALSISDEEGIAQLIAFHIARLIVPDEWALVVFASTTYPEKDGLKAWQSRAFDRGDWSLYRHLERMRDELPVLPAFSDYGLEYPGNYKPAPVRPTAHLRYSTENRYFVFKGASVGVEDKYVNIFRVAESLVNSGIFKGAEFSRGDNYIAQLATFSGKTGHASKWRWCSTDHHLTLVMRQLNSLLNLGIEDDIKHIEPDQLQLILP